MLSPVKNHVFLLGHHIHRLRNLRQCQVGIDAFIIHILTCLFYAILIFFPRVSYYNCHHLMGSWEHFSSPASLGNLNPTQLSICSAIACQLPLSISWCYFHGFIYKLQRTYGTQGEPVPQSTTQIGTKSHCLALELKPHVQMTTCYT